ncbi:MAG: hypothetical protein EOO88_10575 [Pedobacter sp.]|nr:MAG: hypothetical protein EOO88_10575 [Pedobacter sp.]
MKKSSLRRSKQLILLTIFNLLLYSSIFGQAITVMPQKASDYVNGIGINTHLKWNTSVYYKDFDKIIYPKLKALGIKNIRDAVPYREFLSAADTALIKNRFIKLYDSLGIKVCYTIDSKKVVDSLSLRDSAAYLSVFKSSPKLVRTVQYLEGFNEPDLGIFRWYPKNWDTLTYKIQKSLYTRAHSMPELKGIPVLNTSIVTYWSVPSKPNMVAAITPHISDFCDLITLHTYDSGSANWKMFPGTYYDLTEKFLKPIRKDKPWVITEIGYQNAIDFNKASAPGYNPNTYHYLSELSAGKYYSVLFMEMFKRGAKKVYAYEFIDQNTSNLSDSEKNFGIIHTDGTEKPAFTAIQHTIMLLKDVETPFTPTSFSYTLTGDTTNIRSSVFQKADGKYYLALWQGVKAGVNYDYTAFKDLPADSQKVSITLVANASKVNVYQPLKSALPIHTYRDTDHITVDVPDHLLLIELDSKTKKSKTMTGSK